MALSRIVQFLGLAIVTFVMVRSYLISDMLFQFGGLAIGAGVFMIGRHLGMPEES